MAKIAVPYFVERKRAKASVYSPATEQRAARARLGTQAPVRRSPSGDRGGEADQQGAGQVARRQARDPRAAGARAEAAARRQGQAGHVRRADPRIQEKPALHEAAAEDDPLVHATPRASRDRARRSPAQVAAPPEIRKLYERIAATTPAFCARVVRVGNSTWSAGRLIEDLYGSPLVGIENRSNRSCRAASSRA